MATNKQPEAVSYEEYLRRLPKIPPESRLEREIFDRLLMQHGIEHANRLDVDEPKLVLPPLTPKPR